MPVFVKGDWSVLRRSMTEWAESPNGGRPSSEGWPSQEPGSPPAEPYRVSRRSELASLMLNCLLTAVQGLALHPCSVLLILKLIREGDFSAYRTSDQYQKLGRRVVICCEENCDHGQGLVKVLTTITITKRIFRTLHMTFVRQLELCGNHGIIHWSYCKFIIPTPSGNFGKSYNLEFSESLITLAKQGTLGRFPQFHKLINSSGDRLRSVALASQYPAPVDR